MSHHLRLELDGGSVLFTTRHGGVSHGPYASLNLGLWTDDDGDEVRQAFGWTGRTIDLKAIARERLEAEGADEVHDVGICTICDERFFSHRRDRGVTGRQAGVVWRS